MARLILSLQQNVAWTRRNFSINDFIIGVPDKNFCNIGWACIPVLLNFCRHRAQRFDLQVNILRAISLDFHEVDSLFTYLQLASFFNFMEIAHLQDRDPLCNVFESPEGHEKDSIIWIVDGSKLLSQFWRPALVLVTPFSFVQVSIGVLYLSQVDGLTIVIEAHGFDKRISVLTN